MAKYYVVWKGRETGIFNTWTECKRQVHEYPGARYKSFKTLYEAEAEFAAGAAVRANRGANSRITKPPTKQKASKEATEPNKAPTKRIRQYTSDDVLAIPANIKIFTDGACEPNPGEAGSGIAIYQDNSLAELWYGLYNPNGTNNTAELNALQQALLTAQQETGKGKSVAIFCDSMYSIQCVTQWAYGWEKKGWNRGKKEIKNLEIIQEMFALYNTLKDEIMVFHVPGHAGIEGNELADRMSILAVDTQEEELSRYLDKVDVGEILQMRTG